MKILRAIKAHIPEIARLFDLYRQFYECEPDIELATKYITERIDNGESVIFVASEGGKLTGFFQMYPSFCSVDAIKIFILYDLYVDDCMRNQGIGASLMNKASEYASGEGASRIDLMTAFSNKPGQHLYEKIGYKKVLEDFYTYSLQL
jgi:ribosomal protein S18 acetylase RimI-like enzyme